MNKLFNAAPQKVARELEGRTIQIGSRRGTILSCLPRTPSDNASWIDRRPLFTSTPVDVYVAPYRASHLLFLRTGPKNTCVRIDSVELRDGTVCKGPGKVCKAFGLDDEKTGVVTLDGDIIKVRVS